MNRSIIDRHFTRTVLAASIAAIGFATPVVWAADDEDEVRRQTRPESEIEVGIGSVSDDSFKHGDYTGLHKSGAHGIANIRYINRDADSARYFEVVGRNLGLDSRSLRVEGGEQGNFGLKLDYSELPKLQTDSYHSPYNGLGTSRLTAPPGWAGTIDITPGGAINPPVAGTVVQTQMMTALAGNMKSFDVETKRRNFGVALTKLLPAGWDVEVNFKQDRKDGTKLIGAPLQIAGAGSRGTLLAPDPIDYTTNLFDLTARYSGEKLQMQFAYHASLFNNSADPLVFDNLFYNPLSAAGGSTLTGRIGQMPDNQFHQISASGGYTISKDTRLSGSLSLGRMTQDESYLPVTTGGPLITTPVNSLNGKVNTTHADIKLTTRLTPKVRFVAGYRYDDRDNRTDINRYFYRPADNNSAATYPNNATSGNVRWNMPLDNTKQVAYADLDFHLAKATKLKLGYDYHHVRHNYEPTSGDREHTGKAELKHSFGDTASAGLSYARSDRKASSYNGAAPLYATYQAGYLAGLCVAPNTFIYNGAVVACTGVASATSRATTPFLDTPALRKFFLADRKRDKLNAFANFMPNEKLDLQLGGSYYDDRYPDTDSGFGLARAKGWSANFDASLAATEAVRGTFFATFENYFSKQNAHNGASSATVPVITTLDRQNNTAAFDPLTGEVDRIDRTLTLGIGFKVKPGGRYEWGADLTHAFSKGKTDFDNLGARIAAGVLPVPDTVSRLTRLDLYGKYDLKKDTSLNLRYAFVKYHSDDWAWDGQTLTSSTSFIGTGMTSPDYKVHMIGASISHRFR